MAIEVSNITVKFNNQTQKYGFDFRYNGERHRQYRWDTPRKAQSGLFRYVENLEKGLINSNITFNELCSKYLEFSSGSINKNTLSTKRQIINKHIIPTFSNVKIKSISVADISEFLSNLLTLKYETNDNISKFYSNEFLDRIQTELWGIFQFAQTHGYRTDNPTLRLNRVRHNTYQPKKKFYRVPSEDVYKAIEMGHNTQIKLMLMLSMQHGMRPSEIAGLDIEDIDLDKKIIHIKQAWKSKEQELTPTKTGEDRYNATPDEVVELVKVLLEEYSCSGGYRPDMALFGLNRRPSATTMDTWKRKAIDRAGVKHFTWYDLRHTHVTDLLEMGFKPYQVAERLGHDEIQTLDYAIVDIQEQFDMVQALENSRNHSGADCPNIDQKKSKEDIMDEINKLMSLLGDL